MSLAGSSGREIYCDVCLKLCLYFPLSHFGRKVKCLRNTAMKLLLGLRCRAPHVAPPPICVLDYLAGKCVAVVN